jgi:hypothetical protein
MEIKLGTESLQSSRFQRAYVALFIWAGQSRDAPVKPAGKEKIPE